jgi:hypothetical protein
LIADKEGAIPSYCFEPEIPLPLPLVLNKIQCIKRLRMNRLPAQEQQKGKYGRQKTFHRCMTIIKSICLKS